MFGRSIGWFFGVFFAYQARKSHAQIHSESGTLCQQARAIAFVVIVQSSTLHRYCQRTVMSFGASRGHARSGDCCGLAHESDV